mgnify:CR=1 FL=1
MRKSADKSRLSLVLILFFFLLLHQVGVSFRDQLSPLVLSTFNVSDSWLLQSVTLSTIITLIFYIIWGVLFDRLSRKNLLSIAGFIWGSTSILIGIAPTYPIYAFSNLLAGIDNASYSGIYALLSDYFKPRNRGKIIGLFLMAKPLSYVVGIFLSGVADNVQNWRPFMLMKGGVGFVLAVLIYFFVREPKRGASEPAMAATKMTGVYQFDFELANRMLQKPGVVLIYAISFFGMIPWSALTTYLMPFLREIQGLSEPLFYQGILPAIIATSLGYPTSGLLGDVLFSRWKRGRLIIGSAGLILPSLFLFLAFDYLARETFLFLVMVMMVGFFMSFTWPNIAASLLDITLPEVRGTAIGIVLFFQSIGNLVGARIVTQIEVQAGSANAILWVSIGGWMVSLVLLIALFFFIPKDIEKLRRHMAYRSHLEARVAETQ